MQVVVVFYVAIVLLLIGTNLRASRGTTTSGTERRAGRYRRHVVDYRDDDTGYFSPRGTESRLPSFDLKRTIPEAK